MGIFKIGPPRQLLVLCHVVFILQAIWSFLRRRFFLPFWDFFVFVSTPPLPHLRDSAVSKFELPWGKLCSVCQSPWAALLQQASPNRSAACSRREDYRSRASLWQLRLHNHNHPQRLHFAIRNCFKVNSQTLLAAKKAAPCRH